MSKINELKETLRLDGWEYKTLNHITEAKPDFYALVRSVSKSGMKRTISVFIIDTLSDDKKPQLHNISKLIAKILGWSMSKSDYSSINVSGVGMDMMFHTIYSFCQAIDYKYWYTEQSGKYYQI